MCVISGCINSKLAQHLYMLGPNCASSDLRTLQLCGFPLQATQLSTSTRAGLLSMTRTSTMQNIVQLLEVTSNCVYSLIVALYFNHYRIPYWRTVAMTVQRRHHGNMLNTSVQTDRNITFASHKLNVSRCHLLLNATLE